MIREAVVVDLPIGVNLACTVSRRRSACLSRERPRGSSLTLTRTSPVFLIDSLTEAPSNLRGLRDLESSVGFTAYQSITSLPVDGASKLNV